MTYELGSFVRLFAQYFQNLFNEENFCGKFYDKMCAYYCDYCYAFLKRSFFTLACMKDLTLNHQNA